MVTRYGDASYGAPFRCRPGAAGDSDLKHLRDMYGGQMMNSDDLFIFFIGCAIIAVGSIIAVSIATAGVVG